VPVQVLPNRIRARRDAPIEALLKLLAAKVTMIEAPFEPEGGAYKSSRQHDHTHGHDLAHAHHGHSHGHGHRHDH
jgi:urease accessory protein